MLGNEIFLGTISGDYGDGRPGCRASERLRLGGAWWARKRLVMKSIKEKEKKRHLDEPASENDQGGKGKEEASSVGHTRKINKERKKRWLKSNMPN